MPKTVLITGASSGFGMDTAAVDETVAKFGGIDVLINNAGFALMGPLEGASPQDVRREIDTNLTGLIEMIQIVLQLMRKAGSGVIVNVSSVGGRLTIPLFSIYHATKFAVEGLTETLQYELQGHGIRVKLIEPGGTKTNFGGSSLVQTPHAGNPQPRIDPRSASSGAVRIPSSRQRVVSSAWM
jgi:NAD(P)-dependent dehydrogenase (short-subunit alcohol dehydrogenase family)